MDSKFLKGAIAGLSLLAGASGYVQASETRGPDALETQNTLSQRDTLSGADQLKKFVENDNSMRGGLANAEDAAKLTEKLQKDQARDPQFAKKMEMLSQFRFSIVVDPAADVSHIEDGLTGRTYTLHVSESDLKSDKPILDVALQGIRKGYLNDIKGLEGRMDMVKDDTDPRSKAMAGRFAQQIEAAQKTVSGISEILPAAPAAKRPPALSM